MKRQTAIRLGILVILLVTAYVVLRQPGELSRTGAGDRMLVDFDSASVDRIEIRSSNGSVILEKNGDIWNIVSPFKFRATDYMATRAVETAKSLSIGDPISNNRAKQNLFEVDSTGTLVKVFEKGIEKAAIRFGKTTTSFTDTYVRLEGSDDVYITPGAHSSTYVRKPEDWRDKGIYRTAKENITRVNFAYGDTTFSVGLSDTTWQVDGEPIGEPTSFLASLSTFETGSFIDTVIAQLPPLTGRVEVNGVMIRFYLDKEGKSYYVQTSESLQWYAVPLWKGKQLLKRRDEFLSMKPKAP